MVAEVSESHPLVDVFEANDSIINLTLKHGDNGRLMTTAQLRQVYFHMTRDITETLMSASCELTLDELTAAEVKHFPSLSYHYCSPESRCILKLENGWLHSVVPAQGKCTIVPKIPRRVLPALPSTKGYS